MILVPNPMEDGPLATVLYVPVLITTTLLRPRVGTGTYSTSTTTEGASWNDGNKNECFIFSSLARDFGTWFESCVCQHIHCIQI